MTVRIRVNSVRQAVYWLSPNRWPEAVRRLRHGRRARRWCNETVTTWEPAVRFRPNFPDEVAAANRRIAETPMRFGGAGNLDLLYGLCEELQARRVVETGVAYGWSSLAILASIVKRDGHLWSTDLLYPYLRGADYVGIAVPDTFRHAWTLLSGPDSSQLPVALAAAGPGTLDLAHYDSDKSYAGASWGYAQLYEALRPGGVLVADDIDDHLGFRDFTEQVGVEPTVIAYGGTHQGVIWKPNPGGVRDQWSG